MLTKAALDVLKALASAEDKRNDDKPWDTDDASGYDESEIVQDGIDAYIGTRRIHSKTINQLVENVAIRECSMGGGTRHYSINDTGRAILRRPELADEVQNALRLGKGSWTINDKDELVLMDDLYDQT